MIWCGCSFGEQISHGVWHGNISGAHSAGVPCVVHHHIQCCYHCGGCICIIHQRLCQSCLAADQDWGWKRRVPLSSAVFNLTVDCCKINGLASVMVVAVNVINKHWALYMFSMPWPVLYTGAVKIDVLWLNPFKSTDTLVLTEVRWRALRLWVLVMEVPMAARAIIVGDETLALLHKPA